MCSSRLGAINVFKSISVLTAGLSRISTTLVTRLVLNLRERAVLQLPTTVETERRFQAGLPVARRPVASVQNPSSVRPNRSTATGETVPGPGLGAGEFCSQSQSADAIGYETERRSQASLPISRQQVTSVRSSFSVRPNRSTSSVGTAAASRRSADATGYETNIHLRRRLTNILFQF